MKFPSIKVNDKVFLFVVLIFLVGLLFSRPIMQFIDDVTSQQPWFSAAFDVPTHAVGQDPMIAYHLTVNRSVHGMWTASVYRQEDKSTVSLACTGGGYAYYHEDANGTMLLPLSRFIGTSCDVPKGEYRICTNYDLEDSRGAERSFGPFCDFFKVQ